MAHHDKVHDAAEGKEVHLNIRFDTRVAQTPLESNKSSTHQAAVREEAFTQHLQTTYALMPHLP